MINRNNDQKYENKNQAVIKQNYPLSKGDLLSWEAVNFQLQDGLRPFSEHVV